MKINISQLRRLSEILLAHLEATGHSVVDIDVDFYWDVPTNQKYENYNKPSVDVGQLSDDWSELQRILDDKAEPINYALVWFGAVLRRIGETSTG